ncbi:MAG: hypothetical protein CM1200mP30_22870 [Pseudomonadota bacterium]|nr:MAG: hypothetical protein CM1200mP30_22870 [Pseudomonadota bacterium]
MNDGESEEEALFRELEEEIGTGDVKIIRVGKKKEYATIIPLK